MILIFIAAITLITLCIILVVQFVSKNFNENFNDCSTTLHSCKDGQCIDCPDFECVTVDSYDNYIFNDTKVPPGDYCLPKKNGTECNRYTGRWVWTSSKDGSQTWKCECLYPQLFGNDEDKGITDCTQKKACQHPSVDGDNGNLVGNKGIPNKLEGKIWDPVNGEGDADVLMVNPYTTDNEGNPYFSCVCKCPLTALPLTPYACHLDQCWLNQKTPGVIIDPNNGKVTCDCLRGNGGVNIPEGTLEGTCFMPSTYCVGGGWDPDKKMCRCTSGKTSVKCGNDQYGLVGENDINGNEILCPPGNPVGRMCYDPCTALSSTCKNGSCTPIEEKDYKCKCTPPGKDDGKKWLGKNCGPDFCYTKGTNNGTTRFHNVGQGHAYCSGGAGDALCCSKSRTPGRDDGDPCTCA